MLPLSFSPPVLAVEASTVHGAVALWRDGALVAHESVEMGAGRDDRLFPAVQRVLAESGLSPRELAAVVCGAGPGSFTSLRIAAALAKGIAHGAGCRLYAVPSLALATSPALPEGRLVVHADALRGERYAQPLVHRGDGVFEVAGPVARLPAEALGVEVPAAQRVAVISSPLADEMHTVTPTLAGLPQIGGAWREAPVPLDTWEPAYGRLAEAQVQWEVRHGTPLPETPAVRA